MEFLKRRQSRVLIVLVIALLLPISISAQEGTPLPPTDVPVPLDPFAPPRNGAATIAPGFAPDPLRARVTGGGSVNSVERTLGEDCVGYIGLAPDVALNVTGGLPLLRLLFISDALTVDTSLLVRDPAGQYRCNNNTAGLFNPLVSVENAQPGLYAIWIGGFTPDQPVYGDLYITTNAGAQPGTTGIVLPLATLAPTLPPAGVFTPTPPPGTAFDAAGQPVHGTVALSAGFLPDPFWRVVVAGGVVRAPAEAGCAGYADSAPDLRVAWSGRSTRVRLMLLPPEGVAAPLNMALVVRDPAGVWHCNADWGGGYDAPLLDIANPLPGDYAVWATVENGLGVAGVSVLYWTEINDTIETVDRVDTPPAQPLAVAGTNGFSPAGQTVAYNGDVGGVTVSNLSFNGGDVDLTTGYPTPTPFTREARCSGVIPLAPAVTVTLATPQTSLRAFFTANVPDAGALPDPVLVVQMPDGRWYCGDDTSANVAAGGKNPLINIIGNLSTGAAQVWVGGFTNADAFTGTLTVTRADGLSATPLDPDRATTAPPIDPAPLANTQPLPLLDASQFVATPLVPTLPPGVPTQETIGDLAAQGADAVQNAPPATDASATALGLTWTGGTNYGQTALVPGFGTSTLSAIAGGDVTLTTLGTGANGELCEGNISAPADYVVNWSGGGALLRAYFIAGLGVGDGDTTLIIRTPDGRWLCGDDQAGTLSPQVDIASPISGDYAIWIGSYAAGEFLPGILVLTDDPARTITSG